MASPRRPSSSDDYKEILTRYDDWLFDCDGVLWSGDVGISGAREAIDLLRNLGKRVLFVTNNASRSRKALRQKFARMGITASEHEIISSAFAAAMYLKDVLKFPADQKVYVIGMQGIEEELHALDILHIGGTSLEDNQPLPANDYSPLKREGVMDPSVGAVLCGFDMHLNYTKICKAFKYLTSKGSQRTIESGERSWDCHFILTNDDTIVPALGEPWPGAGSLAAPLMAASKRKPIIIGKPHSPMLDIVNLLHQIDKKRAVFVGDNIHTDILFAKRGDIDSILVLTGISTETDCQTEDIWPSIIMQSIADLARPESDRVGASDNGASENGATISAVA